MKRLISAFAVFALLFCLLPVPALAEESYVFTLGDREAALFYCDSSLPAGWYDFTLFCGDFVLFQDGPYYLSFAKGNPLDGYSGEFLLCSNDYFFGGCSVLNSVTESFAQLSDDQGQPMHIQELDASQTYFVLAPVADPFPSGALVYGVSPDFADSGCLVSDSSLSPGEYRGSFYFAGCWVPRDVSLNFAEIDSPYNFLVADFLFMGKSLNLFAENYNGNSAIAFSFEGENVPIDGDCFLILEPISVSSPFSSPSLSGIVDSGMMSGVLDQAVSLLPVLIVTIVTFIATRKGIAFLRGFLAGS